MKNFKFNRTPIDIGAKKNKFKWLLLSFILSIASINTAWAADFVSDGNTYFYLENFSPTSGWGDAMWIANDCPYAWLHVWNDSESKDTQAFEQISGNHYRVKVPAGTWKHFQLYRAASLHNQETNNHTGNIDFSSGKNWLQTYGTASGWTDATWALNREFNGTEKIFIQNIVAEGMSDCWSKDDNFRLYVYLSEGTSNAVWCEAVVESSADYASSTVYSITPSPGCYRYIKLARNNQASFGSGSDGRAYTGNIDLDPSKNYISGNYKQNATTKTWGTFDLSPITSDGTRRLYFDMDPEGITWSGGYIRTHTVNGDGNFAYFFGSGVSKWSAHSVQVTDDYYYIEVPAGTWNGWIITRNNTTTSPSWDNRENQTKDMFFTDNKHNYMYNWYDNGTTAYWKQYAPTPAIILNQGDPDAYPMNLSAGTTYTKDIPFNAHSTYEVQILDGETVYGLNEMVASNSFSDYTIKSGEYQIRVATANADNYTFTYNKTGNQLSVTYPSIDHPSMDYCYVIDYTWSAPKLHVWESASGKASTSAANKGPQLYNSKNINGSNYFCIAPGDYDKFLVSDNGSGSDNTGDLTPSDGYGKYRWNNGSAWVWSSWNFTVTLKEQVTTTSAPSDPSVEFNGAAPSNITIPTSTVYPTFGGYYTQAGGEGLQIIDKDGNWQASKTGYTDNDGKWIHEGGTAELFGKWTQNITLDREGATSGSESLAATYNATLDLTSYTAPTKEGYYFEGYWTGDDGTGSMVINKEGVVQTVAEWTDGEKKWIHNDASTLYAKWRVKDAYTFHYGEAPASTPTDGQYVGVDVAWTGTVLAFPTSPTRTEGTQNYYEIDFTIPDPSTAPNFFVCYEEIFKSHLGIKDGSSSASEVRGWAETYNTNHGYFKVLPGYSPLSDGSSKTAEGAIGKLQIHTSTSAESENLGIGFIPAGYGLTINGSSTVMAFHATENPNLFETDIISGGLTADQVAGTFKVGLATATEDTYVDCYQSAAENASALNGRKVTGTADIATGAIGRFQILINSSATNFGLRYVPLENVWSTPSGAYYWNNYTGWSLGRQPTIDEDVIITRGITVTENNARAKSIRIDKTSDQNAQLRIDATGALLVVEEILAKGEGEEYRPTTRDEINISTWSTNNGALIVGGKSTNTAASYAMYSRSYMYGEYGYINQYVGIPFTSSDRYYFYGAYLFSYNEEEDEWVGNVYGMNPFKAYNIIQTVVAPNGFYLDGILNLPGIEGEGGEVSLTCATRTGENSEKMDYLFANSWTAPIDIYAMTESDFSSNLYPTIYIFNAGAGAGGSGKAGGEGENPGNFSAYTAGSTGTIPSTQGFMVTAKSAGSHSLTLNYKKHVYNPALEKLDAGGIPTDPTRAPKRDRTNQKETKLSIRVEGESGFADRLRLREREDFTNEFDNCFDATKAWGMDEAPQLYAMSGELDMTINAVPDMEGMVVGFRKGTVEDVYTMTFEYDGDEVLYLNDLKEQVSILIDKENSYTFTTTAEDAEARFVISKTPITYVPTGIDLNEGLPVSGSHKFMINGQLYIIREGRMYNANGALVK